MDLYIEAAQGAGTEDETAFFLTHAYIYALETGHGEVTRLRAKLVDLGRESDCS